MRNQKLYSIPSKPSELDPYQSLFVDTCVAKADDYGIPKEEIEQLTDSKATWDAIYPVTANIKTSSPALTKERDTLVQPYRELIDHVMDTYIVNNEAISTADKATLGIHDRSAKRTKTQAPKTYPVLEASNSERSALHILFHDSLTPNSRAKAKGAKFCELSYKLGDPAPATGDDAGLEDATISASGQKVAFTAADKGKTAYFFGRWINAKGEHGPWGPMAEGIIL